MTRTIMSYEREIFTKLQSEKNEVDVYDFFTKFKLSPGHIAKFIRNSKDKNLVKYENGNMSLTSHGLKFIAENREQIYLNDSRSWLKIPEHMLDFQKNLDIEEILDLSKNDIKSFLNY